jgi:histidyl-tRNA synthetase
LNARVAVILGADELAQEAATLRDFDSGEQKLVKLVELKDQLSRYD